MSAPSCVYCSARADWRAETVNGPRDVCQRHYGEIVSARNAAHMERLAVLPRELLALMSKADA